jgi:hypothetical protein
MSFTDDTPFVTTTLFDGITINGRISKKLFDKIITPQIDRLEQENAKLKEENKILEEAVILADKHWFDKTGCACTGCDMGEAGCRTNEDGHDYCCHISLAHIALLKIQELRGGK